MGDMDGKIVAALGGFKTMERAQRDVETAEKAYAESLRFKGIAGFFESARRLGEVKRMREIRSINATVTMPTYLPLFAEIINALAVERGLRPPTPAPCPGTGETR